MYVLFFMVTKVAKMLQLTKKAKKSNKYFANKKNVLIFALAIASLAQLVEHVTLNDGVHSSNL